MERNGLDTSLLSLDLMTFVDLGPHANDGIYMDATLSGSMCTGREFTIRRRGDGVRTGDRAYYYMALWWHELGHAILGHTHTAEDNSLMTPAGTNGLPLPHSNSLPEFREMTVRMFSGFGQDDVETSCTN